MPAYCHRFRIRRSCLGRFRVAKHRIAGSRARGQWSFGHFRRRAIERQPLHPASIKTRQLWRNSTCVPYELWIENDVSISVAWSYSHHITCQQRKISAELPCPIFCTRLSERLLHVWCLVEWNRFWSNCEWCRGP